MYKTSCTTLLEVSGQIGLRKYCSPQSDLEDHGLGSGFTQVAIDSAVLDKLTTSRTGLLNFLEQYVYGKMSEY